MKRLTPDSGHEKCCLSRLSKPLSRTGSRARVVAAEFGAAYSYHSIVAIFITWTALPITLTRRLAPVGVLSVRIRLHCAQPFNLSLSLPSFQKKVAYYLGSALGNVSLNVPAGWLGSIFKVI